MPGTSRTVSSRQLAAAVPASGRTVSNRQPLPEVVPQAGSNESGAQSGPLCGVLAQLDRKWAELPGRYKLVFATSLSFVICNMDKVGAALPCPAAAAPAHAGELRALLPSWTRCMNALQGC